MNQSKYLGYEQNQIYRYKLSQTIKSFNLNPIMRSKRAQNVKKFLHISLLAHDSVCYRFPFAMPLDPSQTSDPNYIPTEFIKLLSSIIY